MKKDDDVLVSAELAKEKLARIFEDKLDGYLTMSGRSIVQLIRNTDLTDCQPQNISIADYMTDTQAEVPPSLGSSGTEPTMSQFANKEDYLKATQFRTHDLKTDPDVFQAVIRGEKTFEIRFDDRGFAVGDRLNLLETVSTGGEMKAGAPLEYTSGQWYSMVKHILRGPVYGLMAGWVIMSIEDDHRGIETFDPDAPDQGSVRNATDMRERCAREVEARIAGDVANRIVAAIRALPVLEAHQKD